MAFQERGEISGDMTEGREMGIPLRPRLLLLLPPPRGHTHTHVPQSDARFGAHCPKNASRSAFV